MYLILNYPDEILSKEVSGSNDVSTRVFLLTTLSSPKFSEISLNDLFSSKVLYQCFINARVGIHYYEGGFIYINDEFIVCHLLLSIAANQHGPVYLYYGCREKSSQPFRNELDAMMQHKVINKTFVAFSRETGKPKVFVLK